MTTVLRYAAVLAQAVAFVAVIVGLWFLLSLGWFLVSAGLLVAVVSGATEYVVRREGVTRGAR